MVGQLGIGLGLALGRPLGHALSQGVGGDHAALLAGAGNGLVIDFLAPVDRRVLVRTANVDVYSEADTFLGFTGSYSDRGLLLTPAVDPHFALSAIPALGPEYSIYFEVETVEPVADAATETWLSIYKASDAVGVNIRIRKDTNDTAGAPPWIDFIVSASGAVANPNSQCVAEDKRYKIASRVKADDFATSFNGGAVQADTSGAIPTLLDNVRLGSLSGTATSRIVNNIYVRKLVIVPVAWTDDQLRSRSAADVLFASIGKSDLIAEIWSGNGLPGGGADSVATSVTDPLATYGLTPTNLLRVDQLTIDMDDNAGTLVDSSTPWVFRPTAITSIGKLAIFNCGHTASASAFALGNQGATIKALVEAGYTVVAKLMPFAGADSAATLANHNARPAPTAGLNSLKFFIEPNVRAINQLIGEGFTAVCEAGLSGGGWTTALHAAVDERVASSMEVAGSLPLYMVNAAVSGPRDWEQMLPGLGCDYHDLYVLACSGGRTKATVLNDQDPSVFAQANYEAYADFVPMARSRADDRYSLTIDTNSQHSVSSATQAAMLAQFAAA